MLESIRGMMGGFIAKVLIGLLVISFAVWGASDVFIGGAGTNTIVVGETKVDLLDYRLAYDNRVNQIQQQFGQRLSREQLQAFGIEQAVLSQMVSGAVLDESARKMGLGMSDDKLAGLIGSDPAFQDASGNFSRQRLDFALRQIGMREEDYIRNRQAIGVRNQLISGLTEGLSVPQAFLEAFGEYQNQRRVFEYVTVTADAIDEIPEPSEAELQEYYEANRDDYVAPEYRELVLVRLTAEDIAKPDALSDEEVEAEYERTKSGFTTDEKRRVQQLTFADQAAAEAAVERLQSGELFETLMSEMDRSESDVDLGLLTKSQIPDQNVANAAFDLELNETSDVVAGIFGPVILRVTEIQAEQIRPLSEVEEEVRRTLALEKATDELYDIHDQLEDERAAGDPLAEAARTVGLTARTVDQVDREGLAPDGTEVQDIPQTAQVLAEAFDIEEGVEADPVSLGTSGFVWYDVAGVTPERQKPFEEVRDSVKRAWIEAETRDRISALAETIRKRVSDGEEFAVVATELLGGAGSDVSDLGSQTPSITQSPSEAISGEGGETGQDTGIETTPDPQTVIETSAEMTRADTSQDLPRGAVAAGFSVPINAVVAEPGAQAPNYVVMRVSQIIEQEGSVPPQVEQQLDAALEDEIIGNVVRDLQSREDIIVDQQAIETAITY